MNHLDNFPTFRGDNGTECWLDVSATSMELIDRTVSWRVETIEGLGLDHELFLWKYMMSSPKIIVRRV